jgi:hypothetical protein
MGLEVICDCCGCPCAAFTRNAYYQRLCMQCFSIARAGAKDLRINRALGQLQAFEIISSNMVFKLALTGFTSAESMVPLLKMKTMALIRHDRILRGEA